MRRQLRPMKYESKWGREKREKDNQLSYLRKACKIKKNRTRGLCWDNGLLHVVRRDSTRDPMNSSNDALVVELDEKNIKNWHCTVNKGPKLMTMQEERKKTHSTLRVRVIAHDCVIQDWGKSPWSTNTNSPRRWSNNPKFNVRSLSDLAEVGS